MDQLRTLITRGQTADLILPVEMNAKDFELLGKWLAILEEASLYDDDTCEVCGHYLTDGYVCDWCGADNQDNEPSEEMEVFRVKTEGGW